MNIRRKLRAHTEIHTGPLNDILFILLLFFLIAATLANPNLVNNPPYIPSKDKEQMRSNVVRYEPHTALFVDDHDPLVFYKALLQFSSHRLHRNGRMYVEIHEDFGKDIQALFEKYFKTEIRKDMQGKDRMIKAFSFD